MQELETTGSTIQSGKRKRVVSLGRNARMTSRSFVVEWRKRSGRRAIAAWRREWPPAEDERSIESRTHSHNHSLPNPLLWTSPSIFLYWARLRSRWEKIFPLPRRRLFLSHWKYVRPGSLRLSLTCKIPMFPSSPPPI
jgi:hypothetical protein